MAKHLSSAGFKLALLAFALLTISASALGKMQQISEAKETDDRVPQSLMQEVANARLLKLIAPYYYHYKQELASKFANDENLLHCRGENELCYDPTQCCSGICHYYPKIRLSICD